MVHYGGGRCGSSPWGRPLGFLEAAISFQRVPLGVGGELVCNINVAVIHILELRPQLRNGKRVRCGELTLGVSCYAWPLKFAERLERDVYGFGGGRPFVIEPAAAPYCGASWLCLEHGEPLVE